MRASSPDAAIKGIFRYRPIPQTTATAVIGLFEFVPTHYSFISSCCRTSVHQIEERMTEGVGKYLLSNYFSWQRYKDSDMASNLWKVHKQQPECC